MVALLNAPRSALRRSCPFIHSADLLSVAITAWMRSIGAVPNRNLTATSPASIAALCQSPCSKNICYTRSYGVRKTAPNCAQTFSTLAACSVKHSTGRNNSDPACLLHERRFLVWLRRCHATTLQIATMRPAQNSQHARRSVVLAHALVSGSVDSVNPAAMSIIIEETAQL